MSSLLHIYRRPGPSEPTVTRKTQSRLSGVLEVKTEFCFNVEVLSESLPAEEKAKLLWLFTETFEPENVRQLLPFLEPSADKSKPEYIFEVGPRLAFTTAWSSNCSSMCQACGIKSVGRIEQSRRYKVICSRPLDTQELQTLVNLLHDRMTECHYLEPLESFDNGVKPVPVKIIPVLEEGKLALEKLNQEKGLGFDDWDLHFYTEMFTQKLQRNPTDVECFDLAQSNSEHSRHWFFGGKMIIDGQEQPETLFQMVKSTLLPNSNSVIAFHDNSSAIYGYEVDAFGPIKAGFPCAIESKRLLIHPILTAETHNFPSGVAPFPGAETGTGGRLRDVQATGRGAHTLAGISSYCVGNLQIPHHPLPWEDTLAKYPSNLARPLDIEIEASNGASDYGNKYGEPVITGFTRSFGQRLPNRERYEWIKPIMFTAGIGLLDGRHCVKGAPEVNMIICKIGGPAYRIGMGGGAASSRVQGTADASLDFDAVQRGDAEMENRMNRVIRACIEMGNANPIVSIHDQGAGGNGNVLKEIVDPLGAIIELRSIPIGDPTLSVTEIWGAEYQENNAFLVKPEDLEVVLALGRRENCPVSPVGKVTGDGRVIVKDSLTPNATPFDLPLSLVLGKMPQKSFHFTTPIRATIPFSLPSSTGITVMNVLERVLKLLDVGSKRFLTNKVDRCVTGMIAQQQCVGPLHTPLSGVGVTALSLFTTRGIASAVGEQPIKGLLSPGAQARMTVAESLANLVFASITRLEDVKASGNWMWAAKLEGEGARMYEACKAMKECLLALGPAIDGGKDSLSMAAKVDGETVKAPGEVTLTVYAPCTDITLTVTPDLKQTAGGSVLFFVDLGQGNHRLGGTALTTVYGQLGDNAPDLVDAALFKRCFEAIQECVQQRLLLAGQDRSDGGLITSLLEMTFAGNVGIDVNLSSPSGKAVTAIEMLFNEELGFVLEVLPEHVSKVQAIFAGKNVPCIKEIGKVVPLAAGVTIRYDNVEVLQGKTEDLRDLWESTSFALEKLQCDPQCVAQEQSGLRHRSGPKYHLTYDLKTLPTSKVLIERPLTSKPRVAVIRQEGSNGDREMLAALHAAGLQAWDVNMQDLLMSKVTLDQFRGIVFCGGFSYADVNDSAKGWAGVIRFNPSLLTQFSTFRNRNDTFTLGICNGCQLMALLGLVPFPENEQGTIFSESLQPRFIHNKSGRFESRWVNVKILPSNAVLLKDMAGSSLGVWAAHGEGKAYFPEPKHLEMVEAENLAPVRYVDDQNEITETYPMNPNGSPRGIAGLCSRDGRHLAMMPHPERCFLSWQLPYNPCNYGTATGEEGQSLSYAPWTNLFHNARIFCEGK